MWNMESVINFARNQPKHDGLVGIVVFQAVCVFSLMICSFVVSDTANMGFNCVLTSFLNLAFVLGAFYVIRSSKAPIAVGFVIGSGSMMFMQNLMASIYWGQLSRCYRLSNVSQYTCSNTTAYGAVSAFSVLLFLSQLLLVVLIVLWRGELIEEVRSYVGVSTAEADSGVINFNSRPSETAAGIKTGYNAPQTAEF